MTGQLSRVERSCDRHTISFYNRPTKVSASAQKMAGGKKKKGARGEEVEGRGQKAPSKKDTSKQKEPTENESDEDDAVQLGEEEPVEETASRLAKVKLASQPEAKAKEPSGRLPKY